MGDTPTYTFFFTNGHWLEVVLQPDQYVKMRPDGMIITNPDPTTGHRKFPYSSMTHYDVTYPDKPRRSAKNKSKRKKPFDPSPQSTDETIRVETARAQMRARANDMLYAWLEEAGMCKGPWDPGNCTIKPTIHPKHDANREPGGYSKDRADASRSYLQAIEDVSAEVDTNMKEPSVRAKLIHHTGDIPAPKFADGPWPPGNGPTLGGFGDVRESDADRRGRPDGLSPVGE